MRRPLQFSLSCVEFNKHFQLEPQISAIITAHENYPALVAKNSIIVEKNNAEISSFVYAGNELKVNLNNLTVIGAITACTNVFGSSTKQANQDAVAKDLMTIASLAQSWCAKPVFMGGGGGQFTGFALDKIDWPKNAATGKFENDNGTFAVNGTPAATEVKIEGTAKNGKTLSLALSVDINGKFSMAMTEM